MNETSSKPVIFLAFANDKEETGAYLRKLTQERNGIRDALMPAQEEDLCEVVVEPDANIDRIIGIFQSKNYRDRIAIFHYGGHADSYRLLLETYSGERAIAHSTGLVSFLAEQKGLQLVFLNGCSTQQQAEELIEAGIPAVVGTSQKINDEVATSLSVRFYKGLAEGITIRRAWKEAEDQVKLEKGATNFRDLYWEGKEDADARLDRFPWTMLRREGAEDVMEWNLPDSAENPLFGLPPLPSNIEPPTESPFPFLKRYERNHAAIFFGRSYYIRELYNRVSDPKSPPIILLYGQSGVGKSSLLDAGLNPRLEETHSVIYIRRIQQWGLAGTLEFALDQFQKRLETNQIGLQKSALASGADSAAQRKALRQLEAAARDAEGELKQEIETLITKLRAIQPGISIQSKRSEDPGLAGPQASSGQQPTASDQYSEISTGEMPEILKKWKRVEAQTGKPLIVILDQMEELYTRPNPKLADELEDFLVALRSIFSSPTLRPQGKLILGYRKEYHPEIDEGFKTFRLPRTRVFLEVLRRKDIVEIFRGLTHTPALKECYHLTVEEELPALIADDLLEDKDSPVAPVLQIVLTKLWNLASKENPESPPFTAAQYQKLRKEGIAMGEFFAQQMQQLRRWRPDVVDSGLALDVLQFHTTALVTAGSRSIEELRQAYQHRQDIIEELIAKCKELYLLAEAPHSQEHTSLAHDTLAPVVTSEYNYSDKPSQRAVRILSNKITDFRENEKEVWLDEVDLAVVEKGLRGMRQLTEEEQKLLQISRQRKKQLERERKRNRILRRVLVAFIIVFAGFAVWQWFVAHEKALLANYFIAKDYEAKAGKAFAEALAHRRTEDYQKAWLYTLAALEKPIPGNRRLPVSESRFLDPELRVKTFVEKWRSPSPDIGPVFSVAVSPDGQTLASVASDTIRLRNIVTGEERGKLAGHTGIVYSLAFSPDGKTLASASADSTIRLWDMLTGAERQKLAGHTGIVYSVAFSPNGKTLASASFDKTIRLWDMETGTEQRTLAGHTEGVNSIAFSPDGEMLASGSIDKSIRLWEVETGKPSRTLTGHNGAVTCVVFNPADGATLASASLDWTVRLWKVETGAQPQILTSNTGEVHSLGFSPDGEILASASSDHTIRLWDVETGAERRILTGHTGHVNSMAFTPDGHTLVSGSEDRTIRLWEVELEMERRTLTGHTDLVNEIAFSPDGKTLASGSDDMTIRLWEVKAGRESPILLQHESAVTCVVFNPADDKIVASGSLEGMVRLWNAETGRERRSFNTQTEELHSLAFSPDGKTLACPSSDRTIRLWDAATGKERRTLSGQTGIVYSIVFSPDGKTLASASSDSIVYLWDVETGTQHRRLTGHSDIVNCLAFSPDGKSLATGSDDMTIRVWDVATGTELRTLTGHTDIVNSLAFSPDGKTLASGSDDKTVRVWDMKAGAELRTLTGHSGGVYSVKFSRDGKILASGSEDQTIRLWPIWRPEFYSAIDLKTAAFDSVLQASFALLSTELELEGAQRKPYAVNFALTPRPSGKDPVRWIRENVKFAKVVTPKKKAPTDISPPVSPPKTEIKTPPVAIPSPPAADTTLVLPVTGGGYTEHHKIDCGGASIDPEEPVTKIAAALEADSIMFDSEPLSDNSGIFHRFLQLLKKQSCPDMEIPEVTLYRSTKDIARWYHQRDELILIQDALEMADLIKPGAVMFYGASDSLYKNFTLEDIFAPDGISHIGIVVGVTKNEAGEVISYRLFHGRSTGKIAGTTNYHRRQPSRSNLPPLGNWNQQWIAFAWLAKGK